MMRECSQCRKPYAAQDFVKEESKGMESHRRALGLEGVRFLYYACRGCGHADIFVDVTTPKFAVMAIKRTAEIGWKPIHLLNNVSGSIGGVLKPAVHNELLRRV